MQNSNLIEEKRQTDVFTSHLFDNSCSILIGRRVHRAELWIPNSKNNEDQRGMFFSTTHQHQPVRKQRNSTMQGVPSEGNLLTIMQASQGERSTISFMRSSLSSFYESLDDYVQATLKRLEEKDPSLRKLLIDDFHYPEVDLDGDQFFDSITVAKLLRTTIDSPNVTELEMRFVEMDDIVASALLELLSLPCREWDRISIVGCTGCRGEFLAPLTLAMKKCKHLTLNHNNIEGEGFEKIGAALQSNHSLRSFHMKRDTLCGQNACDLFKGLQSNTLLEDMVLNFCRFDSKGIDALCESLKNNRSIRKLDLGACYLPDRYVARVIDSLVGHPALTSLVLTLNSCHEEGTMALASLLSSPNCCLQHLNMSHQKAGSNKPCMETLATALKINESLVSLKLSRNSLHGSDLSGLIQSLQENSTLEFLDLTNNNLDDTSLIALARALPYMSGLKSLHILNNDILNDKVVGREMLKGMTRNFHLSDLEIKRSLPHYESIQYYVALNWGGRRALSAAYENHSPIPMGLWPKVLERAQCQGNDSLGNDSNSGHITKETSHNLDHGKIQSFRHDMIYHLLHGPALLSR